jgi:hypothetical protein
MLSIWVETSRVAWAVWIASCFTSAATTPKPRPASPARAASMAALSASRLVCPAMVEIRLTTAPIWPTACASEATLPEVCWDWVAALEATFASVRTISSIWPDESATVTATASTLRCSSSASLAMVARLLSRSAAA